MEAARLRKLVFLVPPLLALLIGGGIGLLLRPAATTAGPDPEAIAQRALISLRDEGRLTPFSGRFVAVVSASEARPGLTARKTPTLPGSGRHGLDLRHPRD